MDAAAGAESQDPGAHLFTTIALSLIQLIGADEVLYTEVSALDGSTHACSTTTGGIDPLLGAALSPLALSHPAVVSYLAAGDDRSPRRVSDVTGTSTWLAGRVYDEAFRERHARHQLSIVTALDRSAGRGWILCRTRSDFDESEVARAAALQPLLQLIEPRLRVVEPAAEVTARGFLTDRELEVLAAASSGVTVRAVARLVGSSEGTVRKHLEHIYRKLNVSSRIAAVEAARERGLLVTRPGKGLVLVRSQGP